MSADPKSAKRQSTHQCLFALLRVKAACKTLKKLTSCLALNRQKYVDLYQFLFLFVKEGQYDEQQETPELR